ncbi:MAG: hypothetical protein H7062_16915 [Candidatus Saccharimonas sp.]|nr:hypothetical protein [Planctomycetaceae bacterium]
MKTQPDYVAYVAAATSWYGLIPVVVLMSLGFGRIDPVLSTSGLLCLFLGAMVTLPPLGLACGFAACVAVRNSDISPYPVAVALALIADLSLVGWLFVL